MYEEETWLESPEVVLTLGQSLCVVVAVGGFVLAWKCVKGILGSS